MIASRDLSDGSAPMKPGSSTASSSLRRRLRMRARRGADAHDVGHQPQQRRSVAQQREKLHARRQLAEELVEAGQGEVGIDGLAPAPPAARA